MTSKIDGPEISVLASIAECRRTFSALESSLPAGASRCALITSASRGEGKTTSALCLAASAAAATEARVLLMDLNWHRPAVHSRLGHSINRGPGTDWKSEPITTWTRASAVPRLDVLAAFESPPADAMPFARHLIRIARENYAWVIVDSASIFPTNRRMLDPVLLARAADSAVLVVLANMTPKQEVKRARMLLESGGVKVGGLIVNHWRNPLR